MLVRGLEKQADFRTRLHMDPHMHLAGSQDLALKGAATVAHTEGVDQVSKTEMRPTQNLSEHSGADTSDFHIVSIIGDPPNLDQCVICEESPEDPRFCVAPPN